MAAPPNSPAASPARSVLDGETRVQIPLEEAAGMLDISRWLAYKLARSGELPTNRVGRNVLRPPQAAAWVLPAPKRRPLGPLPAVPARGQPRRSAAPPAGPGRRRRAAGA
jgi:hypothetical protein